MAEAVDSVMASAAAAGGNVLVAPLVAVVYAGEVLHSTGEWLLADSTFSGEQLHMWLDSESAAVSCGRDFPRASVGPVSASPS